MKDYLNEVNEEFPTRRTAEEKNRFCEYVKAEAKSIGIKADVETLEKKHNNVVIGDPENAKVIYTAHYDTPARSLVPNLMIPRNKVLCLLYQLGIPILTAFVSLGLAAVVSLPFNLEYRVYLLIYLVIYFALFFFIYRHGTNKTNKNDNTSGVATVLSIMSQNPKNTAYILFDNEEKGILGSKAYNKANKEKLENKLMINFDCVGNGENIVVISKERAQNSPLHTLMTETVKSKNCFNVEFFSAKGSVTNTDSKNFDTGISVMACKKSKNGVFYTPYIHTAKDTVALSTNIAFLSESFSEFSNKISERTL